MGSCKKDSNDISSENFVEISVNGQTYRQIANPNVGFSGDESVCDAKPHFLRSLSDFEVSSFIFISYIKHYENNVDFKSIKTGTYHITDIDNSSDPWAARGCNFDLDLRFKDKKLSNTSTTLQTGGIHNVTSIKEVESSSTEVGYSVSGTFSCSFKNSQSQIVPVTGKYQTTLYALK